MDENEKVCRRIHQMCNTIEGLGQELQEARTWAALWKRAAKEWRGRWMGADELWRYECAQGERKEADNKRLRDTLRIICMDGFCPVWIRKTAQAALKETTHD